MPLQAGTTLGPSVTAKIGEGGLGVVSRARIPSSTRILLIRRWIVQC